MWHVFVKLFFIIGLWFLLGSFELKWIKNAGSKCHSMSHVKRAISAIRVEPVALFAQHRIEDGGRDLWHGRNAAPESGKAFNPPCHHYRGGGYFAVAGQAPLWRCNFSNSRHHGTFSGIERIRLGGEHEGGVRRSAGTDSAWLPVPRHCFRVHNHLFPAAGVAAGALLGLRWPRVASRGCLCGWGTLLKSDHVKQSLGCMSANILMNLNI